MGQYLKLNQETKYGSYNLIHVHLLINLRKKLHLSNKLKLKTASRSTGRQTTAK